MTEPGVHVVAASEPSRAGAGARGWVVPAVALAAIAIACGLGAWQLDRAAQKVALQAALELQSQRPPLDAAALARSAAAAKAQHFRPAAISGRWLEARTVFLDNRQMDGKVGFFVVTPLAIGASGEAVLVQRGWVARRFDDRASLPAIATPAGTVNVEGTIAAPPGRLYEFAGAASGPIQQNLDLEALARDAGVVLLPLSILQRDGAAPPGDGLLRSWPAPAAGVQKHYGYAFQWFALGALIASFYVWHRILRPRQRR